MYIKVFYFIPFLICVYSGINSQDVAFKYNFDDCTYEDSTSGFPGLTPGGSPQCVCGIGGKSIYLNGGNDFLSASNQANSLLSEDFTLDFYFWLEDLPGEVDILSHRNGCNSLDSLMALSYFSSSGELLFEIASNVNNYHSVRKKLSTQSCWHRFTLVKFKLEYLVYFDNELVKRIISKENIVFSRLAKLAFSDSPCNINNRTTRFKGHIDEITLYKRALSDLEIIDLFDYPDKIITPNTTIFKGESIILETGNTCAALISWTPAASLDNASDPSPVANPEESTTYQVVFNNGVCTSIDTVRIFVADKEKLDCKKLLLPRAFTPNNDGLNDQFGISNIFLIEKLEYFEVFDRWGAKVWETNDINEKWDGTKKGQPLNGGMYLYKIKYVCNSTEQINIDNFTLLR